MIVSVWLTRKAGEPRIYTTTVQPTREQLDAFKRDGFDTYEARVVLPFWEDGALPDPIEVVGGYGVLVDSKDVEGTGQGNE